MNVRGATGVITIDLGADRAPTGRRWRPASRRPSAAPSSRPTPMVSAPRASSQRCGAPAADVLHRDAGRGRSSARSSRRTPQIYALDGCCRASARDLCAAGVMPVLSTLDEVATGRRSAAARRRQTPPRCISIRLNRLGLPARDMRHARRRCRPARRRRVTLVMSHLASADDPADPKNRAAALALRDADGAASRVPSKPRRLRRPDARAAPITSISCGPATRSTAARPRGGANAGAARRVAFGAHPAGARRGARRDVGYSATWRADATSPHRDDRGRLCRRHPRVRAARPTAPGRSRHDPGQLAPIVGRVSMDLITVDVTDLPPSAASAATSRS